MSDELVQWLREQLDEDERVARGCRGADWQERPKNWVSTPQSERVALAVHDGDLLHIARHDPARVLREVDAAKVLLFQYEGLRDGMPDDMAGVSALEAAIRAKAAVYADRPGYRDEWRP